MIVQHAPYGTVNAAEAVRHAGSDVHSRSPAAPDRIHPVGILERGEARQPGENSAIHRYQITRHDPAVDSTIRDG